VDAPTLGKLHVSGPPEIELAAYDDEPPRPMRVIRCLRCDIILALFEEDDPVVLSPGDLTRSEYDDEGNLQIYYHEDKRAAPGESYCHE
jgi:hypothetical protein